MLPWRLLDPETKASASTRLVLPLAPCPTTAMLRISELLYSRILTHLVRLCEPADMWGGAQPRAQRVVAKIIAEILGGDGDGTAGLPAVADAREHDRFAGECGAPEAPGFVSENPLSPRWPVSNWTSRNPWHQSPPIESVLKACD